MSTENTNITETQETQDFDVVIASKKDDDETVILTSSQMAEKWLRSALDRYDSKNAQYSVYLSDGNVTYEQISKDTLDQLADQAQSDLRKILRINNIVRREINRNDLIGITVEAIETNVNSNYKLSYKRQPPKQKQTKIENIIDDFNEQSKLERLIRNGIPLTYAEGTYIMYLRSQNGRYLIDYYPLGVAIISDTESNGDNFVLIDIEELKKRLKKSIIKTKSGKALFFENIDDEIKANYPNEVYDAYKNKEKYAKLDIRYSGVVRINNLNRKYGLTPIFRALYPAMMLEVFENADRVNTKAKAKKIIHQSLNEKLLGEKGDRQAFEEMAYAHENLMGAWVMPTVVVTSPAYVKNIAYVEPKVELTNVDKVNQYRNSEMTCLGISFLSQEGKQTVSTANISVEQLMKTINKIASMFGDVINKWYCTILEDNGFDGKFAPKIKVFDAQLMDFELRKSLVDLLYSKVGASYKSVYESLGLDVEYEKQRRIKENDEGYDEIFFPHPTSYTISDSADKSNPSENTGRPKGTNKNDKQVYDQTRQETL